MKLRSLQPQKLLYAALTLLIIALGVTSFFVVRAKQAADLASESLLKSGKIYAPAPRQFTAWQDEPSPVNHNTPQDAVLSYLLWTSWAYYMGQSDLAMNAKAMTAFEEPRVTAYISKLIQDDSRINQRLDRLEILSVDSKPYSNTKEGYSTFTKVATVKASEKWTYNYQTISTGKWGQTYTATYKTTYTLYKDKATGWAVDSVKIDTYTGIR